MDPAELAWGDRVHEQLREYVTFDDDGWAHDLVRRVADRLQANVSPDERLTPEVVWLETPTAVILPGRYVYVARELLQLGLSEEATAFVFAHELGHQRLGHVRTWGTHIPGAWVFGVLARMVHGALTSPEKEANADRWAIERCVAAGYDRERCLELFDALERASLDAGDVDGVFGPGDPEALAEAQIDELDGEARGELSALLDQARHWVWTRRKRYESLRARRAALEREVPRVRAARAPRSSPLLASWEAFKAGR